MADGFETLIGEARAFFTELRDNNRKDWFEPRKARYTDEIKKPAELLGDLLADDLTRLTGTTLTPKLFRIYRDVRFSADKTPYTTHLHLSWFPSGGGARPGFFFGAAPDYLLFGTGTPGVSGPALTRLRAAIDRDGDALQAALDGASTALGATLSSFGPEPLKRVPKPYAVDHPHAELLKRKSLFLSADLPAGWEAMGLIATLKTMAKGLHPVWAWLDQALAEATV